LTPFYLLGAGLCTPNPCQNGGSYNAFGTNLYCQCPANYIGRLCAGNICYYILSSK
jgi:hypothetical protein